MGLFPFASIVDRTALSSTIHTALATNDSMYLSSFDLSRCKSPFGFAPMLFTLFDRCSGQAIPVQVVFALRKVSPTNMLAPQTLVLPPCKHLFQTPSLLCRLSLQRLWPVTRQPLCISPCDAPGPRPASTFSGHLICTTTYRNKSNIMERSGRSSPSWGPWSINWIYIADTRSLTHRTTVNLPFRLLTRARVEFVTTVILDSLNMNFDGPLYIHINGRDCMLYTC